jgi:predicted Zn-dependent protease
MVKKAARVSEKLLEYLPLNVELLRKAAALHYQYGDHRKAVAYFLKLEIAGELSREENMRLADALENTGAWADALAVWKNINPVSLDDHQRKAICAYYSGDISSFEDTVNTARSFYKTEGLFQVLRALFELKQGRRDLAEETIRQVIHSRKRDRQVIEFVLDFFLETRQDQKALDFINSLSSVEQDLPEICIKCCLVHEKLADMESCRSILEGISRNKGITNLSAIEGLIELNFKLGQMEIAREMLANYAHRWPLSPNMIDYQARLYIHDGNFNASKEILDDIIKRENPAESWLLDYGLALTGCRQDSFPLQASILNDQPEAKMPAHYRALMDHYSDSISLKIIAAELSEDDRLDQYRSLLADRGIQQNPDIWRVHAGMGKHYYQKGSYDLAVVSFREARKAQPKKKAIELYLINALAKMRLYDDAISIFTSQKIDEALNLDELMEINSSLKDSDRWLKTLEELSEKLSEERSPRIVLAHVYLEKGKPDKVLKTLQGLDFSTINKSEEHLICSQLLIKAGFMTEAKQILEYLLAAKVDLSDSDLLGASFLFCQMDEMHKSANLLNLIGDASYEILAFKTDLYQKLGLLQEAQSAISAAMEAYEDQTQHSIAAASAWIQQPDFWKKVVNDPKHIYIKSIEIKALSRDLQAALLDAQQSVRRFPDSMLMKTMAVNLANLLADEPVVDELLENLPDDLTSCRVTEDMCVWGEIALRKGQEILAASLTSEFLEAMPDSSRVKTLQARLLKRNGNTHDAQQLMEAILDDDKKSAAGFSTGLINEYQVWLAEAAMDFQKYLDAVKLCEGVFEKSGITPRSARTFLSAMMQRAYQSWIDQKLQITDHASDLDESDKKYFADICLKAEESLKDDQTIQTMIASISVWLGLVDGEHTAVNAIYSEDMDKYASIVSRHYREGANKAEILAEQNSQDSRAKFILALLEMESDPEKAAANLAEFIRENGKNPRSYAALAMVKKQQGQLGDAYAAINLALSEWPQEHKWQLLAGELSKQQGDLHAAMDHFRKASESHQDERTQAYLGELNLQAKNRFGIPYLEKQLTGNPQDFDTLIKLGELGIRNSKYQKAAKYLESARHYKPMHPQPYILMSRVALKVGNQAKAEEIINQAMQVKPNDAAVVLQKAAVIQDIEGTGSALAFIDEYANSLLGLDPAIIIRKATYISEIEGDEQALAFLQSQKKNVKDGKLTAETAGYLLKTGRLEKAEETAEQALQADPEDPAHLELLARISTQNGDLDKALDFLVKAIQLNPFMPEFYISMAKIYQSRRDLKQAEDVLQSGLRSNPMNFDLLSSLGLLYYQQGLYKRSEEVLKQASIIDPYNQNIKRILSTLMNANIIQAGTTDDSIIQEV